MIPVERVWNLTPADFEARFEQPELPVVLAGAAAKMAAAERWSPDYLKQKWGALGLDYKLSRSHQHPDFHAPSLGEMFARERGTLGSLIDAVTTGPPEARARRLFTGDERFLLQRRDGQTRVDPELGALLEDVETPEFVPRDQLYTIWAWFSGKGVRTWLHYDNNGCHNLNAQLLGRKRCLLFAPRELEHVHLFDPSENPATNCSAIDVEQPDYARYPEFRSAAALEGELEAGDLLFIPVHFLHSFRHLSELNANLNYWWKPELPPDDPIARREQLLRARTGAS